MKEHFNNNLTPEERAIQINNARFDNFRLTYDNVPIDYVFNALICKQPGIASNWYLGHRHFTDKDHKELGHSYIYGFPIMQVLWQAMDQDNLINVQNLMEKISIQQIKIESYLDAFGCNALYFAVCRHTSLEIVKELFTKSPQLVSNLYGYYNDMDILDIAAASGNLKALEYFIEDANSRVDEKSDYENIARIGTLGGHKNIVEYAIKHGADLNIALGETYMMRVIDTIGTEGSFEMIDYLLEKLGADSFFTLINEKEPHKDEDRIKMQYIHYLHRKNDILKQKHEDTKIKVPLVSDYMEIDDMGIGSLQLFDDYTVYPLDL